jgi:hypothetical protein
MKFRLVVLELSHAYRDLTGPSLGATALRQKVICEGARHANRKILCVPSSQIDV